MSAACFPPPVPKLSAKRTVGTRAIPAMIRHLLILSVLLLVALGAFSSDVFADPLKKERLSAGYILSQFHGVNQGDAEAAIKTLARTLGVIAGYDVTISVHAFEDAHHFAQALTNQPINLIILDSWNYLEIHHMDTMEPMFVTTDRGNVSSQYLLLAREDGGIRTISDLHGRSLNLISGQSSKLARHWLNTVIRTQHREEPEAFFGAIEYLPNPLATLLPVFFGKKDAALVNSAQFELMTELNPQLRVMHTIASSEPMLNAVICLSRLGWSSGQFKSDLVKVLTDLHTIPAGKQILTLFKAGRLVPYRPSYLDTVRTLSETLKPRPGPTTVDTGGERRLVTINKGGE